MYLSRLSFHNFRSYTQLDLSLQPGLSLFYGDNAQGKTNLLEAISMLATGVSFHASSDREVVNWFAPERVARVEGVSQRREDEVTINIAIFNPAPTPPALLNSTMPALSKHVIEMPSNISRKRYKVNGVPKKTIDVIGQIKVVLFTPLDLHLVDGPPDERRRFLDRALCQTQPRYCQAVMKYRKIVEQRSALLKRIRDGLEEPQMLNYLDEQLVSLATQIMYERQQMITLLNQSANAFQQAISGGREQLQIVYRPSFKATTDSHSPIEAQKACSQQLHALRQREIAQGVCLLGPHRDDLGFVVNGINMLTYGSRGQQRTTALAVKLAELSFMRANTGDEPILLLDDVFSELDHLRRDYLLNQVRQYQQVFLTTTDLSGFSTEILQQAHIYHIVDSEVIRA
jgi:DNA replication and repair protein RecF